MPASMTTTAIRVAFPDTPMTIARSIHAVLEHTDRANMSLTEVMGYASLAGIINVRERSIETDGPYCLHGGELLKRSFELLGFHATIICPPVKTIDQPLLGEIVETVRSSLRRGMPVVGWDLFSKHFGVIHGYDDEKRAFLATDPRQEGLIPYDEIPARRILCLCVLERQAEVSRADMLKGALDAMIDHAYGRDGLSWDGTVGGLGAYDAWMQAFADGDKISNKGNAYNVHVVADARKHAAAFFASLADGNGVPGRGERFRESTAEAASRYDEVYRAFKELEHMYPYPLRSGGANPRDKANAVLGIEWLKKAKRAEQLGVLALERLREEVGS